MSSCEERQVSLITVVDGPADKPIMLFIHGYPDDESMWSLQVSHFKNRFRCVRVVLPNYGGEIVRPWGFDFAQVVAMLKRALDALNSDGEPVILVSHDWGAVYGYLFEQQYPHLLRKMVALDVGGLAGEQANWLGYLMIPFYQLNLALAFMLCQIPGIGVLLGKVWSRLTFTLLGSLANLYTPSGCTLSGPSRQTQFSPFQNYPYFYAWKEIFLKGRSQLSGEGFRPLCPLLYVYGGKGIKGYMTFHDQHWLEYIEQNPKSKAIAFEMAGHWLMRDNPKELHDLMDNFLSDVD